jgi:adenine C2-methylase RlmN of 23S rRNA A2503 and tRNA A37
MGMGEPLMNYPNVMKAIDKITSEDWIRNVPKRIIVSTSGISKMIKKMADDEVKFSWRFRYILQLRNKKPNYAVYKKLSFNRT